ncbi:hypothetical protein B9Z19DRAFT_253988 [Tuber borchii]|uniref:Uncharacterized protein n=1 Tax=Tuber borchii TaxID=42251 RepID=A0A2T7A5C8_TUBBO|nr:hypothetical protein B9Z19DRAFT_253988 [Tuber borchii]
MGDPGTNSAGPSGPRLTLEPSAGSIHELSQLSPLSPTPPQESLTRFTDWETIGEQRDFYNEKDCLHSNHNLASEKLKKQKSG